MKIQTLGLSVGETRSNPLENPSVPLSSGFGWQWLLGSRESDAGEVVNPQSAMATGTVNACVRLLSSSIAQSTPRLYQKVGAGRTEASSNPLFNLLALEANPYSSSFCLWEAYTTSLCLYGNAFIEIQRDGTGTVQGLWYLRPDLISLIWQDGVLQYKTTQGLESGFRLIKAADVIHTVWGSQDGILGISPISQARNTFGGNIALERFSARFFANGSMPQMALLTKQRMKPEDKVLTRSSWEQLQQGSNQHRVAVLDQEMDIKILSLSNEDSQFLESRKFSREEICGMFGLKPSQIGSESRVAGETFSGQQLSFLTDTLAPHLLRIRQECTRKLLKGRPDLEIRHDVSDRLKLDVKSQMDAFAVARQWGLMTANQCRAELGLDPGGPECDTYWAPVNETDAKRLLNPPQATQVTEEVNV